MKIGQKLSNEKVKDKIVSLLIDRFRNPTKPRLSIAAQLDISKLQTLRQQSNYTVAEFAVVYSDMLDYVLKFYFGSGLK